jgi:hypothetical protein
MPLQIITVTKFLRAVSAAPVLSAKAIGQGVKIPADTGHFQASPTTGVTWRGHFDAATLAWPLWGGIRAGKVGGFS